MSVVTTEYLETIYNVAMEGDPVIAARLADKFNVSAPNVAAILQRMEHEGLIQRDERKAVHLTDAGRLRAEAALRRHRLSERFLAEVLGLDWITAHEEAHRLEHGLTPEIEERMDEALGHPTTCPHGNPIPGGVPDAAGYLRAQGAYRLSQAELGQRVQVVCVSEVVEDETTLLRYVGQKGMRPGASVVVREREPGGAFSVDLGEKTVVVGLDLASKLWVRAAIGAQEAREAGPA
jgi:DtxR family transcriptional regulator, iron-dependent repressor